MLQKVDERERPSALASKDDGKGGEGLSLVQGPTPVDQRVTDVGASAGEEIGTEADGNSRGTSGWRVRGGEPGGDPVAGGKGPNIWTVAGIAIVHLLHKNRS